MKIRIDALSIVFSAALCACFIVSCAGGPEEKKDGEGEYDVSVRGKVERLEMTVWMYGTHGLVDPVTGEILYALTSDSVVLECYEESVITVKGNLVEGYPVDTGPPYLEVFEVGP